MDKADDSVPPVIDDADDVDNNSDDSSVSHSDSRVVVGDTGSPSGEASGEASRRRWQDAEGASATLFGKVRWWARQSSRTRCAYLSC